MSKKSTKKLYEQELKQSKKWTSAGGVVYKEEEEQIQICLVKPTNGFGGHKWTLPKGKVDPGESIKQAALREVREEAGVIGSIESYLGEYEGSSSITHFFIMSVVEDNLGTDFETEEVRFVSVDKAMKMFTSSRDLNVLQDFISKMNIKL